MLSVLTVLVLTILSCHGCSGFNYPKSSTPPKRRRITLALSNDDSIRYGDSVVPLPNVVQGGVAAFLLQLPSQRDLSSAAISKEAPLPQELQDLIADCRRSIQTRGFAHISNFVRPEIVLELVQEAQELYHLAFRSTERHTIYQEEFDPRFSPKHPRNALQQSSKYIIDYDRISDTSPLKTLYESSQLRNFVSLVVAEERQVLHPLYVSGCPYNAAYYNFYNTGDGLGWHFDKSEFGVNLELQPAIKGGAFEIALNTRTISDPWSFENVQNVLLQEQETPSSRRQLINTIQNPPVGPGSLVIFRGSCNLHRVTPVSRNDYPRINAIMTYEYSPNQQTSDYTLQKFFGRKNTN